MCECWGCRQWPSIRNRTFSCLKLTELLGMYQSRYGSSWLTMVVHGWPWQFMVHYGSSMLWLDDSIKTSQCRLPSQDDLSRHVSVHLRNMNWTCSFHFLHYFSRIKCGLRIENSQLPRCTALFETLQGYKMWIENWKVLGVSCMHHTFYTILVAKEGDWTCLASYFHRHDRFINTQCQHQCLVRTAICFLIHPDIRHHFT